MRGQLSVEMFIAFSLFLFLFGWLANFLNAFHSSTASSSVFAQEKNIAAGLARLANTACLTRSSIQVTLPCIFAGAQQVPSYSINTTENPPRVGVLATAANASPASAEALCIVSGAFSAQCAGADAGKACVWFFNETVRISPGDCP